MSQATDRMGRTTTFMVAGLCFIDKGKVLGAITLPWMPIVGADSGGFVGGNIGYMAGSKISNEVYSGLNVVGNGIKRIAKSTCNGIKSVGNKIKRALYG